MNLALWGIFAYVAAQLAIGFVVSRGIKTEADYLVAGRKLGYPIAIFTIFATWFGAETCVGAAGGVYEDGLSATSADPFGYAACILLMGLVFAVPLWERKLITLADLFRTRYSRGVERFAAILMIPTSVLWAAAQIRAFGQVLAASSDGLSVELAIAVATAIVLAYTVVGGLLADAYTDVVQGAFLMLGLAVLFVVVLVHAGGPAAAFANIEPERLSFRAPDESWLGHVDTWCVPILGSVLAQELIARVSASRSARVARRATFAAAWLYLAFGLMPVALGLMGTQLAPGLADGEQVLPELAGLYLGSFAQVLFVGALVSAILSTVDSALLVAGSLLSHNLVVPLVPRISERGRLRAARAGVFFFGLCAFGLALTSESVHALVEESSGFGSQGILVIAVFGLFTRFGGARAAYVALTAGIGVWLLAEHVLAYEAPFLAALGAATLGFTLASFTGKRPG